MNVLDGCKSSKPLDKVWLRVYHELSDSSVLLFPVWHVLHGCFSTTLPSTYSPVEEGPAWDSWLKYGPEIKRFRGGHHVEWSKLAKIWVFSLVQFQVYNVTMEFQASFLISDIVSRLIQAHTCRSSPDLKMKIFYWFFKRDSSQQYRTCGGRKRSDLVRGLSVQSTAYDQFRRPTKISSLCCKSLSAWESSSLLSVLMVREVMVEVNFFNPAAAIIDYSAMRALLLKIYVSQGNHSFHVITKLKTIVVVFKLVFILGESIFSKFFNSLESGVSRKGHLHFWGHSDRLREYLAVRQKTFNAVSIGDESDNLITQGLIQF